MGNGLYNPVIQYTTIGQYAYNQGLIDEITFNKVQTEVDQCINLIKEGKYSESADYCEGIVTEIYDNTSGAFRYDIA